MPVCLITWFPQLAVLFGDVMKPQDVKTSQRVWATISKLCG